MVLAVKVKLPELERLKVSRVVLISGILTFLYLIEFCIGVRTVYYTFSLWNTNSEDSPKTPKVNLAICIACLMVCIASSLVINVTSALWEQKQMKEDGKAKRVTRFALHILVGAMVWRYVNLWFSDNKKSQKKESLLLAMAKFLFTQIFTVPLVIVHASLIESLEEVVYVVGSASCVSVNLILTCAVFAACQTEVKKLRKWNYETLDLVPLIFCQTSVEQETPKRDANAEKKKESEQSVVVPELPEGTFETHLMRFMVLFQTFGFTFGRLLALGILLKLAGIYAVSIMFLQLLISVVYLKFQVPFLVSDSLPKWRQLTRLAFMSYILIFEWQLNRDPATGYDFTSNIRHSILYYSMATIESIFYFIAWGIADSYSKDETFLGTTINQRHKLVKSIIIVGTMSLIFSLMLYFFLALWQSRRLSALMISVRRRYVSTKLKMTNSMLKKGENGNSHLKRSKLDISNPIQIGDENDNSKGESNLEKHSSYKDLKEPLDEEIEIYVGRSRSACEFQTISECMNEEREIKSTKVEECHVNSSFYISESMKKSEEQTYIESCKNEHNEKVQIDPVNESETNDVESSCSNTSDKAGSDGPAITENDGKSTNSSPTASSANKNSPDPQQKSKITLLSESLGEGWTKFSTLSKRFTGTMKGTFQKRREQFHQDPIKNATEQTAPSSSPGEVQNVPEEEDGEEGFFVGDARCCDYDSEPKTDIEDDVEVNTDKASHQKSTSVVHCEDSTDSVHCIRVEPCPCFVCKPDTEGRLVRRRRSSSVPPLDRKSWLTNVPLSTPSSPVSVRVDLRRTPEGGESADGDDEESEGLAFTKLSLLPPEERIEHYV